MYCKFTPLTYQQRTTTPKTTRFLDTGTAGLLEVARILLHNNTMCYKQQYNWDHRSEKVTFKFVLKVPHIYLFPY